jgi:hypothetical protein
MCSVRYFLLFCLLMLVMSGVCLGSFLVYCLDIDQFFI